MTAYIYMITGIGTYTQVGEGTPGLANYGKDQLEGTANASECVTGDYFGDVYGYVVFPSGYVPASGDVYGKGAAGDIQCSGGGCATPDAHQTWLGFQAQFPRLEPSYTPNVVVC